MNNATLTSFVLEAGRFLCGICMSICSSQRHERGCLRLSAAIMVIVSLMAIPQAQAVPPMIVAESEPNGTTDSADMLQPGDIGIGSMSFSADTDVWTTLVEQGDLIFVLVDTQPSDCEDADLRIYAGDPLTQIDDDVDDGPSYAPVVAGAIGPQSGNVFLNVRAGFFCDIGLINEYRVYQAVIHPSESAAESEANNSSNRSDPMTAKMMTGTTLFLDQDFFRFYADAGARIVAIID
jgi:hypothetical protein